MKPIFTILAVAVFFFVATSPCFALWGCMTISKEEAKQMGMEVRSERAGPNQVRVELEFKTDGWLKNFRGVELQIGEGDSSLVTASLQPDLSKPGRVVVSFTANRAQLDKARLSITVPIGPGGQIYVLRVKDFVAPKKDR